MRGIATGPNSPRDIGVGVVRPREMKPETASKSKPMHMRCFAMSTPEFGQLNAASFCDVMAGLDPAIHVFLAAAQLSRGCPGHPVRRRASRFCPGMTRSDMTVLPLAAF